MIFNEIYGTYFEVVREYLNQLNKTTGNFDEKLWEALKAKYGFGENPFLEDIKEEPKKNLTDPKKKKWVVFQKKKCPFNSHFDKVITDDEARWLEAVRRDPRMRLFVDEEDIKYDTSVEPLFLPEDIIYFDRRQDSDPYEDPEYIKHFRTICKAIKEKKFIEINHKTNNLKDVHKIMMPDHLEYSEKDDKFRVVGQCVEFPDNRTLINLARITDCEIIEYETDIDMTLKDRETMFVEFELCDKYNSLERVLMHFAYFKKEIEEVIKEENEEEINVINEAEKKYKVKVTYDVGDRQEMLIRILSFGPTIEVTGPDDFIKDLKDRIEKQISLQKNHKPKG